MHRVLWRHGAFQLWCDLACDCFRSERDLHACLPAKRDECLVQRLCRQINGNGNWAAGLCYRRERRTRQCAREDDRG